jgi:membrane protein implicated in regulation of membrane protease activity
MVSKVLLIVVALFVLFEVAEHLLLPLVVERRRRNRRPLSGAESMVGRVVEVAQWSGGHGQVVLDGEYWTAECASPLAVGDRAVVVSLRGLTLEVTPLPPGQGTPGGASRGGSRGPAAERPPGETGR